MLTIAKIIIASGGNLGEKNENKISISQGQG